MNLLAGRSSSLRFDLVTDWTVLLLIPSDSKTFHGLIPNHRFRRYRVSNDFKIYQKLSLQVAALNLITKIMRTAIED